MQIHQLRYVVAVADAGRFTRAAEGLRVAQPSVSSAVRALERELGVDLFHRSGGRVTLTTAGEALLPWARQVLADCEAGRSAVRELLGLRRGRLVLGATPSLTTNLMPPVLAAFHAHYPGIDLELEEAGSRDLVARLEQGRMDLALLILPVDRPGLVTRALVDEDLVLAVGRSHPLVGRRVIGMAELAATPLVMFREGYDLREVVLAACRRVGRTPTVAAQGLEMGGVLAMAAAGLGAAVVPSSVVVPGGPLHAVRFRGRTLSRTVGLAHRRDRPLSQAALALTEVLDAEVAAPSSGWRS